MCTRCTPYGLFAGFATGDISQADSFIQFANNSYTPIFRADMLFLKKIKDEILSINGKEKIPYYVNNTIYEVGERFRFIESDKDYNYKISEVRNSFVLNKIVESAKSGLFFTEIMEIIEKEIPGLEKLEYENYINSLISSKILIDDLPPYMTSLANPIQELEDYLNKFKVDTSYLKKIKEFLKNKRDIFNINNIENIAHHYDNILDDKAQLFQIDLKLNFSKNNIKKSIVNKLSKRTLELSTLTRNKNSDRLNAFCNRFSRKFENKEIPLVNALDPHLGVGYDLHISGNIEETPLVENIYFTYEENFDNIEIPLIIRVIIENYINYFDSKNQKPIVLLEQDVQKATTGKDLFPLCDDYYLFGDLLSNSFEDLDKGNFKFNCKASLPSPYMGTILSRFSYHDKKLRHELKKSLRKKEEDFIYAEIVHHPSDRLGNVLLRPNFYDYTIPYVTEDKIKSTKININDIMIKVRGSNITLKSKSLDREIRPRLSSAYNYSRNQLSVIRFLCDLQYHNKYIGFVWDWSVLNNNTYLPRVEYKELILTEARWKLETKKDANICTLRDKIEELDIPQYCNLKDGDNVLLLDMNNEICLNILLKRIKKYQVFLYESFHDSYFLSKDKKKYSTEFIFPLSQGINSSTFSTISKIKIEENSKSEIREFYPGDEWSYFKIYCSHIIGDRIIREVICPFIEHYAKKEINLFWFFMRYEDPDHHIRLRVKRKSIEESILQLKKLLKPLIEEGYVFSLKVDTYKREIERYGYQNIELSEQLFHYDSFSIMKFIEELNNTNDENIRWKVGLISIDLLLDDFEISLPDRIVLFEKLYQNFMPDYVDFSNKSNVKLFKTSIDKKLRTHKKFLDNTLRLKYYLEFENYILPFSKRSIEIKNIAPLIKKELAEDKELLNLLQSYIHMSLNRLFATKARMHELIIYNFMYKTYVSIANRNDK